MRTGGQLIVDCLEAQGVERVFCVPGESYLPVLDALHDSPIATIVCRQEGGAAMMAEADGKMTGRPGVCLVTRGPGATNASAGIHVARQDSTPMVLLAGQIGRGARGRDGFQEIDFRQTFRDLAKWVEEIDMPARIPEVMSHAWHVAMSGRPGPVVLALPEDMLREVVPAAMPADRSEHASVSAGPRVEVGAPAPTPRDVETFARMLSEAQRPFLVVGGSRWDAAACTELHSFAERWALPVGASFRRQHLFDNLHPNYAGDVGRSINPALRARIAEADLVILLGARFTESASQDYTLLAIPKPKQKLIHIHPGAEELGRLYAPDLAINATPGAFLAAINQVEAPHRDDVQAVDAHAAYMTFSEKSSEPSSRPGTVSLAAAVIAMRDLLPDDTIMTGGAGNFTIWLHRFWRFRHFGAQLAPISGTMGYGLPAAVAAKLRYPARDVVCLAGDGDFQMTMQEFGTAMQWGANIIVLVADNGVYGTIRMHQERNYPGRVVGTDMTNPDFAALARCYGGHGETVESAKAFAPALKRARASGRPAIIHLKTDPDVITPTTTLTALRGTKR